MFSYQNSLHAELVSQFIDNSAEDVKTYWGSMGICTALSVNTPTDRIVSLTCCCSRGGPGHDKLQLSLKCQYL